MDNITIGYKQGDLTVLEILLDTSKLLVKCNCGKELIVSQKNFRYRKKNNCNAGLCHSNSANLLNESFGYLKVIGYIGSIAKWNGGNKWECECICGNKITATTGQLRFGQITNCGCKYGELRSEGTKKSPNKITLRDSLILRICKRYKINAESRNIQFHLTTENITDLIFKPCYYCGITNSNNEVRVYKHGEPCSVSYNGIDRVDNTKGYTLDNCVPCCEMCNLSKKDTELHEWKKWLQRAYKHQFETR
jgi:hypothetical protein